MKKMFVIFFSAFSFFISGAQQITISGTEGNRPLVWSDFKGRPDGSSSFYANTRWNIGYTMPKIKLGTDSILLEGFLVKLELDKDGSWVKRGKETDGLLKHEQGHFDIGRLAQLEWVDLLKKTYFIPAELSQKLGRLFKTTMDKYHQMGIKYDAETNHSINRDLQQKWDIFLEAELVRAGSR